MGMAGMGWGRGDWQWRWGQRRWGLGGNRVKTLYLVILWFTTHGGREYQVLSAKRKEKCELF